MSFKMGFVAHLSKIALCVLILFLVVTKAQSREEFYFYQDGVRTPLLLLGEDEHGQPRFQIAGSPDKNGTIVPGAELILTNQFIIQAAGDTAIAGFAASRGVAQAEQLNIGKELYLFNADSPYRALELANAAVELGVASVAEPQFAWQPHRRDTPNDPQFSNQWHLRNTGQSGGTAGVDINVVPWWNFSGGTRQGSGVNIAIVDDGVQHTHPDIAANYKPNLSYDFNGNDSDPSPNVAADNHGTAVAGVAVARGNNGIGVTGVAPQAGLAGIRLTAGSITDSRVASALTLQNNNQGGLGTNHIYSNSWGPSDSGSVLSGPGPLTKAALADAVTNGRDGKGSIFTWAGGNGLGNFDNSNYDGYANSRYIIAVGATRNNNNGSQSFYSEPGANLLVNAPSNGGSLGIATTDLVGTNGYNTNTTGAGGDYTNTFGGTSAATPVVSGVVALMLEANPNLGWRDVKHVLVNSARKNDPTNAGWTVNAAGHDIHHAYGFGTVDASAAATLATTWTNVGPEVSDFTQSAANLGLAIADGLGSSVSNPIYGAATSSALLIDELIKVETVEVSVNVTHTYRGDLQFTLTAPTGTQSILGTVRNDSGDNYNNWIFTSVRHWDEMATGLWTLAIRDGMSADIGTLNSWSIAVYGTLVPEPSTFGLLGTAIVALGCFRRRRAKLSGCRMG